MTDLAVSPARTSAIAMTQRGSSVALIPKTMSEVITFAEMMSRAGTAVPKHCRDQPGICFAIASRALDWGMNPFSVATKTYVVNDAVAYEAQLVAAVIHTRAPIIGRPRYTFTGEGDDLRCTITWTDESDPVPIEYRSPPFPSITPKNSPLWKSDREQQLGYYTIRGMARRHYPELLLGVYTPDEMPQVQAERAETSRSFAQMETRAQEATPKPPEPAQEAEAKEDAPKEPDKPATPPSEALAAEGADKIEVYRDYALAVAGARDWPEIEHAFLELINSPHFKDAGAELKNACRKTAYTRLRELVEGGYGFDFLNSAIAFRCYIEAEEDVAVLKFNRGAFTDTPAWKALDTESKIALDKAFEMRVRDLTS